MLLTQVAGEGTEVFGAVVAKGAGVGLLSSVGSDVLLQVRGAGTALVTEGTAVTAWYDLGS